MAATLCGLRRRPPTTQRSKIADEGSRIMARDDWWRNAAWNEEVEATFFRKLGRARNKVWYLCNQARALASTHPEVALRLLDQYFSLGGDLGQAEAHFYRARAYIALRDVHAAIRSFEAALAREEAFPNFQTWAFLELPVLIALERRSELYDRAIEVLGLRKSRLAFPVQHYKWHGALALILHEQGWAAEARNAAKQALEAAKMTHSGYQYHPNVGLVGKTTDEFGTRLRKIAGEST
jgi:tetratricopeptide (TPR) repeat protein